MQEGAYFPGNVLFSLLSLQTCELFSFDLPGPLQDLAASPGFGTWRAGRGSAADFGGLGSSSQHQLLREDAYLTRVWL